MSELVHIPVAFRPGTRLSAEVDDPNAVNRAIAAVRGPDGDLLVSDIIGAASDPSSPMHAAFTWDDLEAADKQRVREAFYLVGSLIDTKTGEPVYVSRYRETNNPADSGRIRVNVRLLPPSSAPELQRFTVRVRSAEPDRPMLAEPDRPALMQPPPIDMPVSEVVDRTPDEDRSLDVFKRWVEAHKHEPMVLRAALRLLYDAL